MNHVAIKIAYLGDKFSGSQIQPGIRTVEGEVLLDIGRIYKIPQKDLNLRFSSRTDRGVNSLGNVISFYSPLRDNITLIKALNSVSNNIFYRSIVGVDIDFNPRYASRRIYRYVLSSKGLNVDLVRKCASLFVGEHDFKNFCRHNGKSTVASIDSINVIYHNNFIFLDFTARYFLWNMIRRVSAAIYSVGRGNHSCDDVINALNGENINFGISKPNALTLMNVEYD